MKIAQDYSQTVTGDTFRLFDIISLLAAGQGESLSAGALQFVYEQIFHPSISKNYDWIRDQTSLAPARLTSVRAPQGPSEETDMPEDDLSNAMRRVREQTTAEVVDTVFDEETNKQDLSEQTSADVLLDEESPNDLEERPATDPTSLLDDSVRQNAMNELWGRFNVGSGNRSIWQAAVDAALPSLDPDVRDTVVRRYLRTCANRELHTWLAEDRVSNVLFVKIRDHVLDDGFKQVGSDSYDDASFRPFDCGEDWPAAGDQSPADLCEGIAFPSLSGLRGERYPFPIPTPKDLRKVMLAVMHRHRRTLTIPQMVDIAMHGWNLHEIRPVSLPGEEDPQEGSEPETPSAGLVHGPTGRTYESAAEHSVAELVDHILQALEKADGVPPDPLLPGTLGKTRGSLLLDYMLWQQWPAHHPQYPQYKKYVLELAAQMAGIPKSTLDDRIKKFLTPVLAKAATEAGMNFESDLPKVIDALRIRFWHRKPEFVSDQPFLNDNTEEAQYDRQAEKPAATRPKKGRTRCVGRVSKTLA